MDTKHLITFITFAKEQSMTKVSMKLNYAVSTLTDHIGALEAELGVKLIERKGRRTLLTKNGESFLVYANKMMDVHHDACRAMAYFVGVQGLRILATESVALYTMPPVYTRFSKLYPDVELSVSIGNPSTFCEKLRSDEADIAFLYGWDRLEEADIESTVLFQEPVVFVSHPTHHLTRKKGVQAEDFSRETFIFPRKDSLYQDALHRLLKDRNLSVRSKLYMDSGSMIKKCVQMGHGITMLPCSIVKDYIERGELTQLDWVGEQLTITAQALILKKDWTLPAIREIIDLSLAALQEKRIGQ